MFSGYLLRDIIKPSILNVIPGWLTVLMSQKLINSMMITLYRYEQNALHSSRAEQNVNSANYQLYYYHVHVNTTSITHLSKIFFILLEKGSSLIHINLYRMSEDEVVSCNRSSDCLYIMCLDHCFPLGLQRPSGAKHGQSFRI